MVTFGYQLPFGNQLQKSNRPTMKAENTALTDCSKYTLPMKDTLELISGRWKLVIVMVLLYKGKMRFNELRNYVVGISGKVLSSELKTLEENLLISRTVTIDAPVKVEYALTEYGKTLEPIALALVDWGNKHRSRIFGNPEVLTSEQG